MTNIISKLFIKLLDFIPFHECTFKVPTADDKYITYTRLGYNSDFNKVNTKQLEQVLKQQTLYISINQQNIPYNQDNELIYSTNFSHKAEDIVAKVTKFTKCKNGYLIEFIFTNSKYKDLLVSIFNKIVLRSIGVKHTKDQNFIPLKLYFKPL